MTLRVRALCNIPRTPALCEILHAPALCEILHARARTLRSNLALPRRRSRERTAVLQRNIRSSNRQPTTLRPHISRNSRRINISRSPVTSKVRPGHACRDFLNRTPACAAVLHRGSELCPACLAECHRCHQPIALSRACTSHACQPLPISIPCADSHTCANAQQLPARSQAPATSPADNRASTHRRTRPPHSHTISVSQFLRLFQIFFKILASFIKYSKVCAASHRTLEVMNTQTLRIKIGNEVRRLRKMQGLSLDALAGMAGTSYTHLWKVENAQVNAGIDLLARLAGALGVPLRDLIDPPDSCAPSTAIEYLPKTKRMNSHRSRSQHERPEAKRNQSTMRQLN